MHSWGRRSNKKNSLKTPFLKMAISALLMDKVVASTAITIPFIPRYALEKYK